MVDCMKSFFTIIVTLLVCATGLNAATFKFEFDNQNNPLNGIVTGTIEGLSDNGTGAASSVKITAPTGIFSLVDYAKETVATNTFTTVGGNITSFSFSSQSLGYGFLGLTSNGSTSPLLYGAGLIAWGTSGGLKYNYGSNDGNQLGLKFTRISPVTPVPLPAGGLLLLSGLAGVVALKRRKKRAA
jgi:hypothetical protein